MSSKLILIAGFGGQGILFAGKYLAYDGLLNGKQLSWLPSYGPEMRGGTANCSVILSDEPIGSPIVDKPEILIVMNAPSLDKYEDETVSGGSIFVDSALIDRKVKRSDVDSYYIPATKMASDEGLNGLANMIILGYAIKKTGIVSADNFKTVLAKVIPEKHKDKSEMNLKALMLGYNYSE